MSVSDSIPPLSQSEVKCLFEDDEELALKYGYTIEGTERHEAEQKRIADEKAKELEKEKEQKEQEKIAKRTESEHELYGLFDMYKHIEKDEPLIQSYILPRNVDALINHGITCGYLHSVLQSRSGYGFRCNSIHRQMNLFPNGYGYLVSNRTNYNRIIITNTGMIMVDYIGEKKNMISSFKKYIKMLMKNYQKDVDKAKIDFEKTKTHKLAKYYFVPYLDKGIIKLHIPVLRDFPNVTTISFNKLIENVLNV